MHILNHSTPHPTPSSPDRSHPYLLPIGPHPPPAHPAPLSSPQVLILALSIALGMAHVHSHNVIHGDLNPSNVLLSTDTDGLVVAKVSDFGLGIKMDHQQTHVSNVRAGVAGQEGGRQARGEAGRPGGRQARGEAGQGGVGQGGGRPGGGRPGGGRR